MEQIAKMKIERTLRFCFVNFFSFDKSLIAAQTEFSSSQARDSAASPVLLPFNMLPDFKVDPASLPSTILVHWESSSIYGEIHPHLVLLISFTSVLDTLNYCEKLVLSHYYGFKRSFDEIADTLNRNQATVRRILNGVLEKFASVFTDLELENYEPTADISAFQLALAG